MPAERDLRRIPAQSAEYQRVQAAAQFFGLGGVVEVNRLKYGFANDNYVAVCEGGERSVVRVMREHTLAEFVLELCYLDRIARAGLPIVPYLVAPTGERVFHFNGHRVSALRWLDAAHPPATPEVCAEVGAFLARLHRIPPAGIPPRTHWLLESTMAARARKLHAASVSAARPALSGYWALAPFDFSEQTRCIVHGDVHGGNLLREKEGSLFLIDWEEVGLGAAVVDLAGPLLNLCMNEHGSTLTDNVNALLGAYTSLRRLTPQELSLLPKAVQYLAAATAFWLLERLTLGHPDPVRLAEAEPYWNLDPRDVQVDLGEHAA